jgi:hypothetical protein
MSAPATSSSSIERTKYLFIINEDYNGKNKISNGPAAQVIVNDIIRRLG